ncbi:MAG: efflux RND transporter periplasmic adaptor subunit [Desulfuromonadaceae bacterium]|nr:efflux RND transporter periplasmic adaptor subunit [Desulfuromonadaceae bacterium]
MSKNIHSATETSAQTGKQANSQAGVSDLEAILATQGSDGGFLRRWRLPLILVIIALVGAYLLFGNKSDANKVQYLATEVTTDTLVVKVSATGQLEPTNQVNVGSEMSGTVETVFVDDDDRVTKGQVLAVLDLAKFKDAAARSQAAVGVAQAGVTQAQATVKEARSRIERYREVAHLSGGKVPSKTEMDTAEAELARAEANVTSAQASVAQAEAALRSDETDLVKAHIRSPINGVVLERAVDPGQTVAASLQAVTLFTLAEDLSKMELKVDIDEADVGQVKAGLPANFTVDAWPGRRFEAQITRVGYNAINTDGVISYPGVLQVDNSDLSLRPGMTGTAEITTLIHEDALLVPNAALRFSPPEEAPAKKSSRGLFGSMMPRRSSSRTMTEPAAADGSRRIWVLREGQAVPLQIKTGATNGRVTEIVDGELAAGMEVITEIASRK